MSTTEVGPVNSRRLITPGPEGWAKTVDPGAPGRYVVITVDSHASEPENVFELGGIDPKYVPRLPHVVVDEEGRHLLVIDGWARPHLVKGKPKNTEFEAQWERDDLSSNGMWCWPHSSPAIERQLQNFTEEEREKILWGNAARVFGFDPVRIRE